GWFESGQPIKATGDVIATPLTSGENVTQATISHDGKYFVYSSHDGDRSSLFLQAIDRSSRSEILPRSAGFIGNLTFSPDDKTIYFVRSLAAPAENGLFRIPVSGGPPVRVLETNSSPVSFSADGSKAVFVRPNPNGNGLEQIVQTSIDGSG